ncbi:hypothetical protein M413DRAFT_75527, partial [Hebeloma cylindrosporum]
MLYEDDIIHKASLIIIELSYLETLPNIQLLVCTKCEYALFPHSAVIHSSTHGIILSKKDKPSLQSIIDNRNFAKKSEDVPSPTYPCAPIDGLKQSNGFACILCTYCCVTEKTMSTHISINHKGSNAKDKSKSIIDQALFGQHPKYFAVVPSLVGSKKNNLFAIYLQQYAPYIDSLQLHNPPLDANEVPPLLKIMQWHEHLKPYTGDRMKVQQLMELTSLPTSSRGESWMGEPLRLTIEGYIKDASHKGNNSPLGIKCLLMECPRVTQTGEHWRILPDNSIGAYSRLLHQWTHAIMVTIEGHVSGYQFPLTDQDMIHASDLKDALQANPDQLHIDLFHIFIKPLLYPKDHSTIPGPYTKWNEVFECFYALSCLREDGNFQPAGLVTQMFAKMKYFIRGTVLYEGLKVSTGDHYAAVECEALINFRPGATSPMNGTIDYQRFASSIAMNTSSPPATRVSSCGMFITYKDKTLDVSKWRSGLRKRADEVTKEIDDLCLHQTFDLHIPDDIFDDWGNDIRGYSWTKNNNLPAYKRCLLAAMLETPKLKLGRLNYAGEFKFDIASLWEFIHKCDSINEKLALLCFFTAGQTPRVSEFIEHKYANSTKPRTIFMDRDGIWFVIRRGKIENIIEKETFLPIKCYPELSRMIQIYLLLIRPVEAEFVKILQDDMHYHVYKEYLWTKGCKRVTPEQMRLSILKFNTNYCDVAAGTQEYRQICVQMGRTFLGSEFEINEHDIDALATQAGHTIAMSRLRYALEFGKLPSMSSDLLLRFGRVSEAWWEHAGFKPNCAPILPLHVRQKLRDTAPLVLHSGEKDLVHSPIIDTQTIIVTVTSAVIAEVQKMQTNLDTQIRKAVAEAL